jgi:hypothetical protein
MPMTGIILTTENAGDAQLYIEISGDTITISDREAMQNEGGGQWIAFNVNDAPDVVEAINKLASR